MSERDRYLRELGRRLRLRGGRRADALAEIESHIAEGVAAGEDERAVVERLGEARDVARALNRSERPSRLTVLAAAFVFAAAALAASAWPDSAGNERAAWFSVFATPPSPEVPATKGFDDDEIFLRMGVASEFRVLAEDLGPRDARLIAWLRREVDGERAVCYSLEGHNGYCWTPGSRHFLKEWSDDHFIVSGLEWHAPSAAKSSVQLFGVAFDDVVRIRVQVAGAWRDVPIFNNGFYVHLPNVRFEAVGLVEATLADGSTNVHDVKKGA